jgi:outer membrane protein insertion porin family/translocation and assembly module TamA
VRRPVVVLVLALVAPVASRAHAVALDALDPTVDWRIGTVVFEGNHALTTVQLQEATVSKARPWYRFWEFWRPRPPLEPAAFRADLDRLAQLYRNHGYYHVHIDANLELPAQGYVVRAVVSVSEGSPVYVASIEVELRGTELPEKERVQLLANLPLVRGHVFSQDAYERGYTLLRTTYREHGFARVIVKRSAEVDLRRDAATVRYTVDSGPASVFGDVQVSGTTEPDIVRREIAWKAGAPFRQSLVDQTRNNLVALRLFRSIRLDEDKSREARVDFDIHVLPGPQHEVRFGVGYDTEEEVRGFASWRDYDFLGDARQLGFTARASVLTRAIVADFLQPHFPGLKDRVRLILSETQEDEETYLNDRSRASPRLEWQALPTVTAFVFYRAEYDSLSQVNDTIKTQDPAIAPPNSVLSGFGLGFDWNDTDNLLDPTRGWVLDGTFEPVGGPLGGSVSFVRMVGEVRRYQPLPSRFTGALRFRLGAADPRGNTDIPLFERFYAGGINSVRGYARRHVGPFLGGDPIGGRTLIESSVELRHPVSEHFGVAVFVDGGQVSTKTFDFPFGDLRYGTGLGVRYSSPIGPFRLDLGFPIQAPPPGDQRWQVYVSIGQTF